MPPYSTIAELHPVYEIRQLQPEHLTWVQAIVAHSMAFDSPIWSLVHPGRQTQRAYDMFKAIEPSSQHCIHSNLSYGVFIKNWTPSRPDSGPNGHLHWDFNDLSGTREDLLNQMDFPLVSIAMSQDGAVSKSPPPKGHISWNQVVPHHDSIRLGLKYGDDSWTTRERKGDTYKGRVVKRSGTHTRGDHVGKGLAKTLAHHVMRTLAEKGFQHILIHTGSDAVNKVWEHPPEPYRAEVVSVYDTAEHPDPFGGVAVMCKRIWVTLQSRDVEEEPAASEVRLEVLN